MKPEQLADEVLITYPVSIDRLDIYTQFLGPAGITPKRHKTIETTDIMLQMMASGRASRRCRAGSLKSMRAEWMWSR